MALTPTRTGIAAAIAALTLVDCGATPAPASAPAPSVNCGEWMWAFDSKGSNSIRPATTKTLTLTSLRIQPGQSPTDEGVCDNHATSVTWESSDPTVAFVGAVPPRSATVVGLRPGISNVIARFLVDGAPMSASTQITVLFAIFAAAPVVESGSRLPLQPHME